MLAHLELRALERLAHPREPLEQRLAVRQHDADAPAQHLGLAGRQMELAASEVDPHIVGAGHQIGIAREPEPRHVKERRDLLVRDQHVDVLEGNDIADILDRAVVFLAEAALQRPRPASGQRLPNDDCNDDDRGNDDHCP